MTHHVERVRLADILPLRELYRHQMRCQIVRDSWPQRGWTDSYLLQPHGRPAGYASIGGIRGEVRDTVTEFYLPREFHADALPLFRRLVSVSAASVIETQSNDRPLTLLLYDTCTTIEPGPILFEDALTTHLPPPPGAVFRRATESEKGAAIDGSGETVGDWVIEADSRIVATGGLLFHYNPPYGDIYMDVAAPYPRRGLGSFLVQELKRVGYEMGKIPAARCNPDNTASRATLQKAGLLPCGRLLRGRLDL